MNLHLLMKLTNSKKKKDLENEFKIENWDNDYETNNSEHSLKKKKKCNWVWCLEIKLSDMAQRNPSELR